MCHSVSLYYVYNSNSTVTTLSLFLSVYNLFVSITGSLFFSRNYMLYCSQLFRKYLHIHIRWICIAKNFQAQPFYSNVISHKAGWITIDACLLCLALSFANTISITNVLEIERACFPPCFFYTDVVAGLLITSSMDISFSVAFVLSFFILNDIRSFPFS